MYAYIRYSIRVLPGTERSAGVRYWLICVGRYAVTYTSEPFLELHVYSKRKFHNRKTRSMGRMAVSPYGRLLSKTKGDYQRGEPRARARALTPVRPCSIRTRAPIYTGTTTLVFRNYCLVLYCILYTYIILYK